MICYNENGKRVVYNLNDKDKIGNDSVCGKVYLLPDNECLKVLNKDIIISGEEVLRLIRKYNLANFYNIHELFFNERGNIKAYTADYYEPCDMDILTTSTDYTLDNLFGIYRSILKLTQNSVYVSDMHDENVIIGKKEMTVIDVDLYSITTILDKDKLRKHNIGAVRSLFTTIYVDMINKYHEEDNEMISNIAIQELFLGINGINGIENTVRKLERYKYPIDYITKANSKNKALKKRYGKY
ncbi:MAG: hypothetical protein ACI31S_05330 [Bacilli bacterium]